MAYRRLNPLTKLTLAAVVTLGALLLGGLVWPAILLMVFVVPGALAAGVARRVARTALLASLPIAIAAGLVLTLGGQGLEAAGQVSLRLFVIAAALGLFGLTTPAGDLVADLERRGASPRLAFAAAATLGAVPALVEQARTVRDAQRARGLDIDGGPGDRLRGVVPLTAPVVLGTLHAAEARTLALEARAFGRPGRRHLLWAPADRAIERAARWALVAALGLLIAAAASGAVPRLP